MGIILNLLNSFVTFNNRISDAWNSLSSYAVESPSVCIFGRPFVKRFALCYQTVVCLSVLSVLSDSPVSVCDVGVLWPNGWTDQNETWHAGRPRPWPHCVSWRPTPLPQRGANPHFWPVYVAAKWLDGSRCHLVWR